MLWFGKYRKPIGYTIGISNLIMGLAAIAVDDYMSAVFWLVLGSAIVIDTKYFKQPM